MTKEEKEIALKVAREAIKEYLISGKKIAPPKGGVFDKMGAVFVTLHTKTNKALRGCIGSIIAHRPLGIDLVEHAIDAAVNDPRFNKLTADELDNVEIEISVLNEPKALFYQSISDLLNKIRAGIDGLVIRYENYQATFLPTVWQQIPQKELFLSHLCAKAGLEPNFWQSGKLKVFTYQSEVFGEGE